MIQMYHSLNSLKGGYIGDYKGTTIGVIKGDTRTLDYDSDDAPLSHGLEGRRRIPFSRRFPGPKRTSIVRTVFEEIGWSGVPGGLRG